MNEDRGHSKAADAQRVRIDTGRTNEALVDVPEPSDA
ncbi:hypothetical protein PC129_g4020 [Phytophthora cactorum]|uniref:Uncharacterized protein n=1 Tax=Phytophthora cactorum TaxID=29920 RepID=A0A8T1L605_9STRA|nr:hypothetical protein Pcac1_g1607 [Phytophthora cactorum]KAG2863146.1 hypothetical protein PC113_g5713 [Phytophthora cactorum]KAG2921073.1 hypothetical protein PC114_g5805 [Phytophthora cactorum]KAG2949264.1 hypothetical protein PC117_g5402 [Phytophthora cactorum]KAG3029413.1 hypothetical protein PC120_g4342 [Phytophthora cactorum]